MTLEICKQPKDRPNHKPFQTGSKGRITMESHLNGHLKAKTAAKIHGPIILDAASAEIVSLVAKRSFHETFGSHKVPTNKPEDVESYLEGAYGPGKLLKWDSHFAPGLDGALRGNRVGSEWFVATIPAENLDNPNEEEYVRSFEDLCGTSCMPADEIPVGFVHVLHGSAPEDAEPKISRTELSSLFLPQLKGKAVPLVELSKIYIVEAAKGMGIGTRLLNAMLKQAKDFVSKSTSTDGHTIGIAWLGVWEFNTGAVGFYEKHGFEKFGRHTFLMGSDAQEDLLYARVIEADELN